MANTDRWDRLACVKHRKSLVGQLDNNNGSMCARHDELQVNWVTEYMNAVLSQSRWLVSNAIVSLRLVSFTKQHNHNH